MKTESKFTFHRDSSVSYRGRKIGFVWKWNDDKRNYWACCDISFLSFGWKFRSREAAAERLRKETQ
jgi:hypothetical protein